MLNVKQNYQLPCNMPFPMCSYRLDKSVCAKHLAGLKECIISYREKSKCAKRTSAAKRQQQRLMSSIPTDPSTIHGSPD